LSEEYDLRKSEEKVGQLYPVLLSKDGKIIDGLHRLNIDSKWRTEVLEHIDTREKFLKARIIANLHRRTVPASEIRAWINELAELALTEKGIKPGQISRWIADETGYSRDRVTELLEPKYKNLAKATTPPGGFKPPKSPSISTVEAVLGREVVERLKADLKEEAKEELKRDPDFIIEAATKAAVVLPTLPEKPYDSEGRHIPTVTKIQREELTEALTRIEEEAERRRHDPVLLKRGELNRMLMALNSVKSVLHLIKCPICGKPAAEELGFLCDMITVDDAIEMAEKQLEDLK